MAGWIVFTVSCCKKDKENIFENADLHNAILSQQSYAWYHFSKRKTVRDRENITSS